MDGGQPVDGVPPSWTLLVHSTPRCRYGGGVRPRRRSGEDGQIVPSDWQV